MLKDLGVASYKGGGIELNFSTVTPLTTSEPASVSPPPSNELIEVPIDESKIPPDLRADALMDQDKVLNWSAPGGDDHALPLTGDTPLTEGV